MKIRSFDKIGSLLLVDLRQGLSFCTQNNLEVKMDNIQIFQNSEFGEIRTIAKDGEPMFCLADVCKALEIKMQQTLLKD